MMNGKLRRFWHFEIASYPFNGALASVQFSHSVMSDSLQPQHARPPCPSPTPIVDSDSWPSSRWCHPNISSSVDPFSCPQSLPASGYFQMSQLFAWGSQSTGVSASTSVLPMNTEDWSPLGSTYQLIWTSANHWWNLVFHSEGLAKREIILLKTLSSPTFQTNGLVLV